MMSGRRPFHKQPQTRTKHYKSARKRNLTHPSVKNLNKIFETPFAPPSTSESSSDSLSDENSRQSPEENIAELYKFYEHETLNELLNITPSLKLVITPEDELIVGLENHSSNLLLKQARKQNLKILFPEVGNHFKTNKLFLVEYPKSLKKVDGTFSVFDDKIKASRATELIQRLDGFHRRKSRLTYDYGTANK